MYLKCSGTLKIYFVSAKLSVHEYSLKCSKGMKDSIVGVFLSEISVLMLPMREWQTYIKCRPINSQGLRIAT